MSLAFERPQKGREPKFKLMPAREMSDTRCAAPHVSHFAAWYATVPSVGRCSQKFLRDDLNWPEFVSQAIRRAVQSPRLHWIVAPGRRCQAVGHAPPAKKFLSARLVILTYVSPAPYCPHDIVSPPSSSRCPTPPRGWCAPRAPVRRHAPQRHRRRSDPHRRPAAPGRIAPPDRPCRAQQPARTSRPRHPASCPPPASRTSQSAVPSRLAPALPHPGLPPPYISHSRCVVRGRRPALHPGSLPRPGPRTLRDPQHPAPGSRYRHPPHIARRVRHDARRRHATRDRSHGHRCIVFRLMGPPRRCAR